MNEFTFCAEKTDASEGRKALAGHAARHGRTFAIIRAVDAELM